MILAAIEADIARLEGELQRTTQDNDVADAREIQSRLTPLIAQRDDTDGLHLTVLRLIGQCGFDALQVRDQSHEAHYRRLHRFRDSDGRATPIVSSDAHSPDAVFASAGLIPYMKLDVEVLSKAAPKELFAEIRKRSLRFGETRTTYSTPGRVSYWIEGLEIVPDAQAAREFWQQPAQAEAASGTSRAFTLPLSRNLNCFVGGRGSGKSALIEAIAFLTDDATFKTQGSTREKDRKDWYRRADATFRGCRLRLVWKTTSDTGIGSLTKRALVVSRYFDPDGRHAEAEIRDAGDNAIVDATIKPPQIRLLRAHEIEETAQSDNLRNLFDDLCGDEIATFNQEIDRIRAELSSQRKTLLGICDQLADLTRESSPLRQYGIRKMQFEVVDKPDLRARFAQVDHAEAISKVSKSAHDNWSDLETASTIETLEENVSTFFGETAASTADESGQPLSGFETLHSLFQASADPKEPALRDRIVASVRAAKATLAEGESLIAQAKEDAAASLHRCRDDLAKDGLPTGSSEREAKKRAFDEAKAAHQKYQGLVRDFDELLVARKSKFNELVEACKHRTTRRTACAEELTLQLKRDLDGKVIRIEVEAKPLAEKTEFVQWLEKYMDGAFAKFKHQRRGGIIESGLMPASLREILLHDGTPEMSALVNQRERADDGRIGEEECQRILEQCRGRRLVMLDESETWDDAFKATLPEDLQNGVLVFPATEKGLCIGHVFELDEVVLDDVPEIRLNDRPAEPKSVARPLRDLSPGQRCSAILPILLLSGDYPLVIDQPEENLDNRLRTCLQINFSEPGGVTSGRSWRRRSWLRWFPDYVHSLGRGDDDGRSRQTCVRRSNAWAAPRILLPARAAARFAKPNRTWLAPRLATRCDRRRCRQTRPSIDDRSLAIASAQNRLRRDLASTPHALPPPTPSPAYRPPGAACGP